MALSPNALQPFIWGRGGAALTPEQVAREREIAEALVAQGIDTSPVGHWTQGAARMANVLAGKIREGRAASAESAGRAAYNERLSGLFGGGAAATAPAQASIAPELPSTLSGTAGTSTVAASIPAGERASYIRQGLVQRGLPGHVADAFLMNFQDESGLDPGINERAPLVPGSRGGFGLYQLTGPRRRAYEAFASERGSPLDDIDAQLDFLMQEGSGAERAAFERILAAPDTGTAAVEIVNRFLRPAPEHRQSRAARYMRAPNTAAAANEAMATGQLATAAQPSNNSALSSAVQGYAPIVAETPEDIMAAEAAMMDPAFASVPPLSDDQFAARFATTGGPAPEMRDGSQMPGAQEYVADRMAAMAPALPEPRMVDDLPVADIARSLTGATLADDRVPMAGGASSFAPVGTQAPNVSLPTGAQFTIPEPQQQVAQSLAQGGGQPSMQQLIELASDPWATPAQRQVVGALLQQQMDAADPMRQAQLEKLRLETEALRSPAAPKLINAGDGRLYDPGTGQWIVAPDMGTAKPSEAEARIARLTDNLMATGDFLDPREAQNIATGIVDGRLRTDRHPITGVLQVVDMATGQPAYQQRATQPSAGDVMTAPQTTLPSGQFGQQFPNAPGAFGLEGAAQGAINRASDAIGIGPVYPDVAQTQADFAVLRESLLNDMASSYGRQPPSWLLKEIRDLTPEAGSAFQGPAAAQAKLNALGRHLQGELDNTNRALQRDLSPTNRQEMEARQQGLIAGLERVNGAIRAFQPQQQQQQGGAPQPGAVEDGYRFKGGDPADPNNWEPVN